MAPRALQMFTCFSIAVPVPLPAGEEAAAHGSAKKGRWSGEFKRRIVASARRERIRAVKEEEEARDADDVEKQSTPQRLRPALKRGRSPRGDGAPVASATAVDGTRKRTGLRVRFVLPEDEVTSAAPVEPPPFPTGVLGEPPESFRHSGPEMTAAFLASVAADAGSAATPVGHELVSRWTERKEACSRRLSYLRDYCPFQREEDEESAPETATTLPAEPDHADNCQEDEESAPETETATTLPAEPDHADNCPFQREEDEESAPATATTLPAEPDHLESLPRVKTGLAFDSPEAEAEFVKAIRKRYLLARPVLDATGRESLMAAVHRRRKPQRLSGN